jgi:hypothetical protein
MTYKHVKLEDSSIGRSLIKVAYEKGLIKEEPSMVKTASTINKNQNYTISGNLMENVLTLCAGLRTLGLEKAANELEGKFVDYKRAAHLYDAHGETGEDVIDMAHPDGSHKISDIEGDAVVETILDQHLKMVNVVNKKPTGKLATSLDILKAVKNVVAQQVDLKTSLQEMLKAATNISAKFNDISWIERPRSQATQKLLPAVTEAQNDPSEDNLKYVLTLADKSMSDLKSGMLGTLLGGVDEVTWEGMLPHFNNLKRFTSSALKALKAPAPAASTSLIDQFNIEYKRLNDILSAWRARVPILAKSQADKAEGLKWIDKKANEIKFVKDNFDRMENDEQKLSNAEVFITRLKGVETAKDPDGSDDSFAGFKAWLG